MGDSMSEELVKIGQKIVGWSVLDPKKEANKVPPDVLNEKTQRPKVLDAKVYKIKGGEHAYYITVSDITLNEGTEDEYTRPYEIFIASKDMMAFSWIVALTRMISAVMRKGGDIDFIVEELKSVHDPSGGYFYEGKYIHSIVAHIGEVIRQHLHPEELLPTVVTEVTEDTEKKKLHPACPSCGAYAYIISEGCGTCAECGYSKCS